MAKTRSKKATKKRPAKMWVYVPPKPPKPKVSEEVKAEVMEEAQPLIEAWKRKHIKEPPKEYHLNYIVELYTKWFRSYFYFCAKYACPGPTAISPFFEVRFARLEYVGNKRFNLAYLRHTGQWIELEHGLTLPTALKSISENPWYQP